MSKIYVICHNIRSRHNVGSIFRTADGAGVSKIFLCGITPAPPHPNIEKVSLGAEKFVPWEKREKIWRVIDELKKEGVEIISLEQTKNSISLNNFKPAKKPATLFSCERSELEKKKCSRGIALILGEEVRGLPKTILGRSDKVVHIPMHGKKESLNVATAFGIVIYKIKEMILLEN